MFNVLCVAVDDDDLDMRSEPLQKHGGAWKKRAAYDADSAHMRQFGKQTAKCTLVESQDEALQERRTQDDALKSFETQVIQPPQHGGPAAEILADCGRAPQFAPVPSGRLMVLDVITVIEEQKVV